jgi:hypothetical protein
MHQDLEMTMAVPEYLGPGFDLLAQERLPASIFALARHVYVRLQRTPGIRGQAPTSAVEIYVDLSSGDLAESERSHWQGALGCTEGLHIVANEHRSQLKNLNAALDQLRRRSSIFTSSS